MDTSKLPGATAGASLFIYDSWGEYAQCAYTKDAVIVPRELIGNKSRQVAATTVVPKEPCIVEAAEVADMQAAEVADVQAAEVANVHVAEVADVQAAEVAEVAEVADVQVAEVAEEPIVVPQPPQPTPTLAPSPTRKTKPAKEAEGIDAWYYMVSHVDDMVSLYTDNMIRDAIQTLKDKLTLFMTNGAGHKHFGPKKSRTILAWITNNKRGTPASDETAKVIAAFISWVLDVSITPIAEATVPTNTVVMYRKKGCWMLLPKK